MSCVRAIRFDESVYSMDISPDGQLLAVGTGTEGVILQAPFGHSLKTVGDEDTIASCIAFAPACSSLPLVAFGSFDGRVQVWDYINSACIARLQNQPGNAVFHITFSPNSRLLAMTSNDNSVQLWRTDDWSASLTVLMDAVSWPFCMSFSCDSRLIATNANNMKLWHILDDTGAATAHEFAGPVLEAEESPTCLVFSPVDSKLLACGSSRGRIVLARVGDSTVKVERKIQGHIFFARSLAFTPCGQTLASASFDNMVRLWNVASSACLRVLQGCINSSTGIAFFPNGKQLVSGSFNDTVRIWTVCAWRDFTHHLFGAPLKAAVFNLMCVRAKLEQGQGLRRSARRVMRLPRLPMEVWLLICGQLALAMA